MRFLNFKRVLCLSPHPDDSEIGVAGSILKFKETHFDILCLTRGGAKDYDETNEFERKKEVNHFWNFLKNKNVSIINSKYNYICDTSEPGWINHIEKSILKKHHYDCLLIPSKKDSNYEHRFVNKFSIALCRFSKLSIIEYQTFSTLNTWKPDLFINIKNYYSKKLEALKKFKSQKNKPYFKKISIDSFHSNFQCSKKGLDKIEKFKIKEIFYY